MYRIPLTTAGRGATSPTKAPWCEREDNCISLAKMHPSLDKRDTRNELGIYGTSSCDEVILPHQNMKMIEIERDRHDHS